jgi:lysophospholipase L1-like esterase
LNKYLTSHISGAAVRRICHLLKALVPLLLLVLGPMLATAQKSVSIPEEIEWTWEVRPAHTDPQLPNVLLLGDSISRNYFPDVTKNLNGIANVYLMAVSTSVGDPRLAHQIAEFAEMEKVNFRVVHFNNGMHGWDYTEAQYKAAFPDLLRSVRSLAGKDGVLIWANITPVKPDAFNGATNPRIDERNRIAQQQVQAAGIAVDDQHTLMTKHLDLYQDTVHFGPAGANLMGDQAAETIRVALRK